MTAAGVHNLQEEKEEKKRREEKPRSLLLPGLLAGAGLGAIGASQWMMGSQTARAAQRLIDANAGWRGGDPNNFSDIAQGQRQLREYVEAGGELIKSSPFGSDAKDVVKVIRTSPEVMKIFPHNYFGWGPPDDQHYKAFETGPAAGYLHFIQEQVDRAAKEKTKSRPFSSWNPFDWYDPNVGKHKYELQAGKDISKLRRYADELMREKFPETISLYLATDDQQRAVLDDLDSYLANKDPAFLKKKQQTAGRIGLENVPPAGENYSGLIVEPMLKMRNVLLYGGLAAGGIGGALMLRAYLKNRADKKDKKRRAKREAEEPLKEASAQISSIPPEVLATLFGTGLGAGTGLLFGGGYDEEGRPKSRLGNALIGGLIGGGGAGVLSSLASHGSRNSFKSSPTTPAPLSNSEAVAKKYMDLGVLGSPYVLPYRPVPADSRPATYGAAMDAASAKSKEHRDYWNDNWFSRAGHKVLSPHLENPAWSKQDPFQWDIASPEGQSANMAMEHFPGDYESQQRMLKLNEFFERKRHNHSIFNDNYMGQGVDRLMEFVTGGNYMRHTKHGR